MRSNPSSLQHITYWLDCLPMKYGVRPQVKDIKYNATANCIGIVVYHKYKRTDGTLLSWFIWTYSIPKSFFNWFKSVNTTIVTFQLSRCANRLSVIRAYFNSVDVLDCFFWTMVGRNGKTKYNDVRKQCWYTQEFKATISLRQYSLSLAWIDQWVMVISSSFSSCFYVRFLNIFQHQYWSSFQQRLLKGWERNRW